MLRNLRKNKKGQSIFEFLVFVPFLLLLLQAFMRVGGAINGSINQQKHLRGYFYYKLKNSSYFPSLTDLGQLGQMNQVGYSAFGWNEKLVQNRNPKAPCYLLNSFFGEPIDTCGELTERSSQQSQFVRVYSVYGLCGAVYTLNNDGNWQHILSAAPNCVNTD